MHDSVAFSTFLIIIFYLALLVLIVYLTVLVFIALHRANKLMKYKLKEYEIHEKNKAKIPK